jgi:DNA recombination protein RmuC
MEIILFLPILILAIIVYLLYKKNKTLFEESNLLQQQLHSKELENSSLLGELNHTLESFKQQNTTIEKLNNSLEKHSTQIINDSKLISTLQTKLDLQEQYITENETKLKNEFKNLANEILEGNSKKLTSQNKETLSLILNPVKEQINEFKKKVEDVYEKETKERNLLSLELKSLKELNLKMSSDAINLTNALKGQKKQQGIWGEMVLENVLENSGLREGYEYKKEVNLKDENNTNFRPDVIINLPEERHIIIDAKTSLNSYNEYSASNEEDEKALHLKKHIFAIKEHINSLANKKYEDLKGINSLDFIFMFIPIEGALLLALENDVTLYDNAFKQKIILVSPTTLLVALRAVENSWRYERQAQNISDVAKRADLLYNKFTGFVEDMDKLGDTLKKADDTYQKAFSKLSSGSGNLIAQVENLKKVSNIKPKKEIKKELVEKALDE